MRIVIALLWAYLGLANPVAGEAAARNPRREAAPAHLPRLQLYGRDCTDLSAWAKLNQLELKWNKPAGNVLLTNRWLRLEFTVDSRRTEINGVCAWLSAPITPRDRDVYIASLDLQTLLNPILKPARNKPGKEIVTVVLDPGHGGKDPGYEVGKQQEKRHTLLLAQKVRDRLQAAGLKVVLTRSTDVYVELTDRVAVARRQRADLFVSLHYNATDNGRNGAKGIEVYCLTPAGAQSTNARGENGSTHSVPGNAWNNKNILLAYQIQKSLTTNLKVEDRGVKRARFAVLKTAEMPAVLIEGGFMTDPAEAKEIYDENRRAALAQAIVDGILAYKRLVER